MFTESNISALKDRLGWSEFEKPVYSTKLNEENKVKTSGITLNSFHKLITVENVYQCQPERNILDEEFSQYLTELLDNVIRNILTEVYVLESRAIKGKDYSGTISEMTSAGIFDKCIGYCHAVKVLEIFTSSVRSNRIEAIAGHNYALLMSELKGYSTKEGVLVSKGLLAYCEGSRKEITDYTFGFSGPVVCDATNH